MILLSALCLTSYTQHTYKAQAVSTQPGKIRSYSLVKSYERVVLMGLKKFQVTLHLQSSMSDSE